MTEVGQAIEEPSTATSSTKVVPLLRSFIVFNTAQIDALPERLQRRAPIPWNPCDEAETLIAASGATLRHGDDRACYVPSEDAIQLPTQSWFPDAESYYATALHELTHWSGSANRCNRPLGMRHGIEAYTFEELVAEMGSAFLSAHCGLTARIEHASYVESWLRALRQDKRLIFFAALPIERNDLLMARNRQAWDAYQPYLDEDRPPLLTDEDTFVRDDGEC